MANLAKAMKAQATFTFHNTSSEEKRLCLFPGHFDVTNVISNDGKYTVNQSNNQPIVDAGYACDQMAYDNNGSDKRDGDSITVTANSRRTRYADFLNYIKLNGLKVSKIRIQNLNSNVEMFDQEMEISASCIGGKAGSDFIQFSEYVSPNAYDRSFIVIDLESMNLVLDNTTLALLTFKGNAKLSMQFFLSE